jgi:hypothetical protein
LRVDGEELEEDESWELRVEGAGEEEELSASGFALVGGAPALLEGR